MYGGLIPGTANFWRGDPADSRLFAVSYSGGSDSVFCGTGVDFVYCVTDKKSELT